MERRVYLVRWFGAEDGRGSRDRIKAPTALIQSYGRYLQYYICRIQELREDAIKGRTLLGRMSR